MTWPLTASADSYFRSNSYKAKIHFPILPFKIGSESMYLITSSLLTTTHSADNKYCLSLVQEKYKQRHNLSIGEYLVSASKSLLLTKYITRSFPSNSGIRADPIARS